MSKSILVIDTPEKCDGCILHGVMIGKQICNAEIKKDKRQQQEAKLVSASGFAEERKK